ncbi:hypothetical protein AB0I10_33865 [Streptomyces sp. NPDC050636]|uniref:hypothetical protein n=1 Tax=Streptomyces sp. NPDC050636 TaxID=3154510 RepID=UPI00342DED50
MSVLEDRADTVLAEAQTLLDEDDRINRAATRHGSPVYNPAFDVTPHDSDALEVPVGVLFVDDVLATGGTLAAVRSAVEEACGATVERYAVLTEIAALNRAARPAPIPVDALRTVTAVPQAGAGGENL